MKWGLVKQLLLPLAAATIFVCSLSFAGQRQHIGSVGLGPLKGKVGEHFSASITYQVGWFTPRRGSGREIIDESCITSPEYIIIGHLPPGLSWDGYDQVEGTPLSAGAWTVYPGVRDSREGTCDHKGIWFAEERRADGKDWLCPKRGERIEISQ